jgi:GH25 family lysozyme M1 (1,4-beta-N-acetylmuramidase)
MLIGNDVSEFQGAIDWPTYKNNTNFVVMKASEGNGYIDGWFGNNRGESRSLDLPRGFYHFARPDLGNTPEAEAQFFVNLLNGQPLQEGEILCLDYEVNYHDPVNWCKAWLDKVFELTTVKPLIYLNQSTAALDWSPVVDADYGLWLASYQADGQGNTGKWISMAMQQTGSTEQVPGIKGNVDRDVFFGDVATFRKYGFQLSVPPEPTPVPSPQPVPTPTPEPVPTPIPVPEPLPTPIPTPVPQVSWIRDFIDKILKFFNL